MDADPETGPVVKPTDHELVGRVFDGRFRVTRFIDKGGMGAVYEGVDLQTDTPVALKVLTVATQDQLFRRRFFNEAALAASLRHDNAVRVLDFGAADDGMCFMVMELLQGSSLNRHLRARGPLPPAHAIRVAIDICDVLREAHDKGFIHRDLKPSNIFVTGSDDQGPTVKVLDFGLAKRVESDSNLTVPGTMLGSPKYMSPEQLHGAELGPASDLYNVGLLLFRMLTGQDPFRGETMQAILIAQATRQAPSLASLDPSLADHTELQWIVTTCMEKRPEDRFISADTLAEALGVALAVLRGEQPSAPLTLVDGKVIVPKSGPAPVPTWVWGTAAVGVGLCVAAVLVAAVGVVLMLL